MDLRQPLAGDQTQPQVRGHGPLAGVVGETGGQVEIGLLEDVGGVDAAQKPAVEPEADHLPQPGAVALPERTEGRLVARGGATQEVLRVVRV